MKLTKDIFKKLFPFSSAEDREKYLEPFNIVIEKYEINTCSRLAAFCAQVEVESGSLHYVEEIADGSAYEFRKDLGNLTKEAIAAAHAKGSTTGKFYKGHGLIQVTGYYNHKEVGLALDIDTVNKPELLTEPLYAVLSAGWFWYFRNCNDLADIGNFSAITKRINGGFNGSRERIAAYSRNKHTLLEYFNENK